MMFLKSDTVIGRSLDLYGEWCENEMRVLGKLLKPGDWVVDVGANIGTHTVFFAKAVGAGGRVHAVEPQRIVRNVLSANIALNDLTNVYVLPIALGAEGARIATSGLAIEVKANHGRFSLVEAVPGKEQIRIRRADDLNLRRCNLLKIDVEGFELDVLRGAENLVARHRPAIWVENNLDERNLELTGWLSERHHSLFWHFDSRFNADNFRHVGKNIFAAVRSPSSNMLALPREREAEFPDATSHLLAAISGESLQEAYARWNSTTR